MKWGAKVNSESIVGAATEKPRAAGECGPNLCTLSRNSKGSTVNHCSHKLLTQG